MLRASSILAPDDTSKFHASDCVMLIGVPDPLVFRIAEICQMPVVRSRFPEQATQRMLTVRPHVVVVGGEPSEQAIDQLEDVAAAVNAQLLFLRDLGEDPKVLEPHLRSAVFAAAMLRKAKT